MQVVQEFLLNLRLNLEGDFTVASNITEDFLHLATVVAAQVLPQLDQHWSKFKLDVVTSECWCTWRLSRGLVFALLLTRWGWLWFVQSVRATLLVDSLLL